MRPSPASKQLSSQLTRVLVLTRNDPCERNDEGEYIDYVDELLRNAVVPLGKRTPQPNRVRLPATRSTTIFGSTQIPN